MARVRTKEGGALQDARVHAGLLRVLVMCVDSLKMHALGLNQAEQDREIGPGLQVEALGRGHGGVCSHAAGRACDT